MEKKMHRIAIIKGREFSEFDECSVRLIADHITDFANVDSETLRILRLHTYKKNFTIVELETELDKFVKKTVEEYVAEVKKQEEKARKEKEKAEEDKLKRKAKREAKLLATDLAHKKALLEQLQKDIREEEARRNS